MATNEIGLAVMATTLSLVVIFLPVAFMTGQVGRYFFSFGIASAAAILISMFVSFTLTPALCSIWLRPTDAGGHGKKSKSRGFYAGMDRGYGHMLSWSLHHRLIMLMIAAAVSISAVLLFPRIGKELVPDDDQSEFSVNVRLPRGTSFAAHRRVRPAKSRRKSRSCRKSDDLHERSTATGAEIWVGLTPLEDRRFPSRSSCGGRACAWPVSPAPASASPAAPTFPALRPPAVEAAAARPTGCTC